MVPAHNYEGICQILKDAFEKRYRRKDCNITGLLFAQPQAALAKAEVIPHIDYWHHRSDQYTDFFCGGYGSYWGDDVPDKVQVTEILHNPWYFSPRLFAEFVEEIQSMTTWKYSGGADVIVTNARYDSMKREASLDFSTAIVINLDKAKQDQAIQTVSHLFELIFEFAKNLNESIEDPAWVFSDQLGMHVVRSSLKELLLSFLPKSLRPEARKAFYYAAGDIGK
jgi:hypothetical protein